MKGCLVPSCKEIPVLYANSVDPDQTPHSVVSDLGLLSLQMFDLWDARHKWININRKLQG